MHLIHIAFQEEKKKIFLLEKDLVPERLKTNETKGGAQPQ